MQTLVSIVIPAYNRAQKVVEALKSIQAQTYTNWEVIVVDDGSSDKTCEVVAEFAAKEHRIRLLRHETNRGGQAARNTGIKAAKGEWIAFLDSDDYWVPEKLAEQVKVLDAHKNVGIVYARMPIINEKGEQVGTKPAGVSGRNFKELIELCGDLPTSTVMTRRECFDKTGMFDTTLMTMQDIDMWLRISRFYDLYEIENKTLAYYSRHDEQITKSKIKVYQGLVRIYTKILNNYDDAPKQLLINRITSNQYTLSRNYYFEGLPQEALKNVLEAVQRNPRVGLLFVNKEDNLLIKIIKFIKPYSFLAVCLLKNLKLKTEN